MEIGTVIIPAITLMAQMAITQGTRYTVNFILIDTVTSEKQSFRGWPDFCITEKSLGGGGCVAGLHR